MISKLRTLIAANLNGVTVMHIIHPGESLEYSQISQLSNRFYASVRIMASFRM